MTNLSASIFDMDGLLIDTEPIWRQAEIEIFGSVGLHLTEEQCLETMGVPIGRIVDEWYERHPWIGPSPEEITDRIEDAVIQHVLEDGEPLPGVMEALELVRRRGLAIAIASSSSERMIRAVVQRLGIQRFIDVQCSAEHEAEGKPHPAVYLTTARLLGVDPVRCVALEDSPNGVLSAKRAGMFCIAVPDPHLVGDARFEQADTRLQSLTAFDDDVLDTLDRAPVVST